MEEAQKKWQQIIADLTDRFGKKPDLNAILFLIGLRELGHPKSKYTKEEKVKLIDLAVKRILSESGYYRLEGEDEKGWPHFKLNKKMPFTDPLQEEYLLKVHVVHYFETEGLLDR